MLSTRAAASFWEETFRRVLNAAVSTLSNTNCPVWRQTLGHFGIHTHLSLAACGAHWVVNTHVNHLPANLASEEARAVKIERRNYKANRYFPLSNPLLVLPTNSGLCQPWQYNHEQRWQKGKVSPKPRLRGPQSLTFLAKSLCVRFWPIPCFWPLPLPKACHVRSRRRYFFFSQPETRN